MSYCRFSSNDYQCDVYVYDHVDGGITIHVAGNRIVYKEPLPAPIALTTETVVEYGARYRYVSDLVSKSDYVNIDHPLAGTTHNGLSHDEAAEILEHLRAEGFVVPQYAIDDIREEANEPTRR